jgi:UDP-glucose 4-epimerase
LSEGSKRALVTGGAGFIGCNAARHLLKHGWRVSAIDNLSLGKPENLPAEVELFVGDLAEPEVWERLPAADAVIHLGGASSAPMFADNLAGCFRNNVEGFIRVLEWSRAVGATRVVYASTSSVYGNVTPPLREDGPLDNPNFYAVSKFCMEQIARMYHLQYGLDVIGFRFMSVYGPREEHKTRFANLVSQFIWDVEAGRSPVVYGDGTQTRDFTNVWDIAEAIRLALEHPTSLGHEIFNVGTSEQTALNDLLRVLSELMTQPVNAEHIVNPVKTGYVQNQAASLEHVEQVLGFRPSVTLRDGIREILELRK